VYLDHVKENKSFKTVMAFLLGRPTLPTGERVPLTGLSWWLLKYAGTHSSVYSVCWAQSPFSGRYVIRHTFANTVRAPQFATRLLTTVSIISSIRRQCHRHDLSQQRVWNLAQTNCFERLSVPTTKWQKQVIRMK